MHAATSGGVASGVRVLAALQAERHRTPADPRVSVQAVGGRSPPSRRLATGDGYPVTTTGRIVAALLMLGGISLIGAITATLRSDRGAGGRGGQQPSGHRGHIEDLRGEIRALREELASAARSLPTAGSGTQEVGNPVLRSVLLDLHVTVAAASDAAVMRRLCGSTPRPSTNNTGRGDPRADRLVERLGPSGCQLPAHRGEPLKISTIPPAQSTPCWPGLRFDAWSAPQ